MAPILCCVIHLRERTQNELILGLMKDVGKEKRAAAKLKKKPQTLILFVTFLSIFFYLYCSFQLQMCLSSVVTLSSQKLLSYDFEWVC